MGSYLQWRKGYPSGKRFLYICGEDKALVADVLKEELSYRPINPLDYVELDGKSPIADIMDALNQYAKNGYRVVVIRNADLIKKWGPLIMWATDSQMKQTTLICVGNDVKPDTTDQRFSAFKSKNGGLLVECRPLNDKQLQELIMQSGTYTVQAAELLVEKTAGGTARIFNEMQKLSYLDGPVDRDTVETYVMVSESDRFVEALFSNDKKLAMRIASHLEETDFNFIFGSLEYDLTNLILLLPVRDKHMEIRDIAERTGIPLFLVGKYLTWGRGLTGSTLYRRIKLLANADAYYRKGLTTGIIERVCVLW